MNSFIRGAWTRGWLRILVKKPLHCVTVTVLLTMTFLSVHKSSDDPSPNTKGSFDKSNLASSGTIFKGDVIRKFPTSQLRYNNGGWSKGHSKVHKGQRLCRKWGVLTTIFSPPSEAVRRFSYLQNWCLVIVGDKKLDEKVIFPFSIKMHLNLT